jgi:DNA-directed RNA polymerase subunit L
MRTILAHSLEMAEADVLKYVDKDALSQIKNFDEHPQFAAYAIGHEGESGGDLTIQGQRVRGVKKKWLNDAIQSLYEKIKAGTKVFHLHAQTNEHEGRRSIGQVVGKALEVINDKLTAIVITYIEPAARAMGLDVASMEADLRIDTDGDSVIVSGIDEVTGIALASSKFNRPGFPGATLLATVQEMAGGTMTVEEIKGFLASNPKIRPSELFNSEVLKTDPVVIHEVREATAGEYAHRKRTDEAFDKARADWDAKEKQLQGDLKTAKSQALTGTVKEKAKALMESRKLDEQQAEYLSDYIKDFTIDDPENVEVELNKKLDDGLKSYDHLATKIFKTKKSGAAAADGGNPPTEVPVGDDAIKETQAYKELTA